MRIVPSVRLRPSYKTAVLKLEVLLANCSLIIYSLSIQLKVNWMRSVNNYFMLYTYKRSREDLGVNGNVILNASQINRIQNPGLN